MHTVSYSVPAMHCGHCTHTIQTEVGELAGVTEVVASLDTRKVTVSFDAPATEDQIVALLKEINYPPVII
ncbi:MAG: heavy-metal-associated domain-containing protein [Chloroflexi bacterium]|nr:heavy-metal-associated domain-containing protein [Chloroflexota bacterium]